MMQFEAEYEQLLNLTDYERLLEVGVVSGPGHHVGEAEWAVWREQMRIEAAQGGVEIEFVDEPTLGLQAHLTAAAKPAWPPASAAETMEIKDRIFGRANQLWHPLDRYRDCVAGTVGRTAYRCRACGARLYIDMRTETPIIYGEAITRRCPLSARLRYLGRRLAGTD